MDKCGTYAGVSQHRARHEPACDECRPVAREYMQRWREANPDKAAVARYQSAARTRALWRLADIHYGEFEALYEDELTREQRGQKRT